MPIDKYAREIYQSFNVPIEVIKLIESEEIIENKNLTIFRIIKRKKNFHHYFLKVEIDTFKIKTL